jgi:hypothetical protein
VYIFIVALWLARPSLYGVKTEAAGQGATIGGSVLGSNYPVEESVLGYNDPAVLGYIHPVEEIDFRFYNPIRILPEWEFGILLKRNGTSGNSRKDEEQVVSARGE